MKSMIFSNNINEEAISTGKVTYTGLNLPDLMVETILEGVAKRDY